MFLDVYFGAETGLNYSAVMMEIVCAAMQTQLIYTIFCRTPTSTDREPIMVTEEADDDLFFDRCI
jgi:hypothetical protein